MAGDSGGTTEKTSSGTVASVHADVDVLPLLVGPTTGKEFNRIRPGLFPKGCFSVEDSHFEFDSSFIFPLGLTFDAGPLKNLLDQHPGFKLSVFGHADPVGKDDFNKILSGRRAQSIFGMLVRNTDLWADLYFHHDTQGRDKWGVKSVQIMLNFVSPTKAGKPDGKIGTNTKKALSDFEEANSLPAKGFNAKEEIDPATFGVMAGLYMDAICTDDDGKQFKLSPEDFIAAGKGNDGKGDFQGCGEFNPLMMFSKSEKAVLDQAQNKERRNKENQINRRIMILLFRPGTRVDPEKWPCPTVKEGVAGCLLRFHSDSDVRRSNLDERREHKDEKDKPDMVGTFACRFYDRLSSQSPCEGGALPAFGFFDLPKVEPVPGDIGDLKSDVPNALPSSTDPSRLPPFGPVTRTFSVRLYDPFGQFIPDAPFEFSLGDDQPQGGKADSRGIALFTDIVVPNRCTIRWGHKPNQGEPPIMNYSLSMFLTDSFGEGAKLTIKQRLNNLGYSISNSESTSIAAFQRDYGHLVDPPLASNGTLDSRTENLINEVYDSGEDTLRQTRPTGTRKS